MMAKIMLAQSIGAKQLYKGTLTGPLLIQYYQNKKTTNLKIWITVDFVNKC